MKTLSKIIGRLSPFLLVSFLLIFIATPLAYGAERDFAVFTNSDSYGEHSTVRIQIRNTGTEILSLKHMWWMVEVKEGSTGREVYTGAPKKPAGTPDFLNPGELAKWTWDMKDNEGNYQPPGRYRVKVYVAMPKLGYEDTKISEAFTITSSGGGGGGEVAEVTLTSDRKKYNKGNIVTFTLKNTGTKELDTSRFSWIVYRLYSSGPVARSTHNSRPSSIPDPMPVGYSASWSWDMRNNSGNIVGPDNYELEVKLLDEGIEGNCFFKVVE